MKFGVGIRTVMEMAEKLEDVLATAFRMNDEGRVRLLAHEPLGCRDRLEITLYALRGFSDQHRFERESLA